ncbi:hypothetical protein KXD96_11800 [Mycobacterium sp. SMC-2]|nr:hypothetical protein [Mycobacterium sp. SMC-2]UXA08685.1 hypothetical protein KXD96_11800 [Mycobacterium sp. SMC-2]
MSVCLPTQLAAPARPMNPWAIAAFAILVTAAIAVRGGHNDWLTEAYW